MKFNLSLKKNERQPSVSTESFVSKQFKKQIHSTPKNTNLLRKRLTDLLSRNAIINRSKHQTDSWRKRDRFLIELMTLKVILQHSEIKIQCSHVFEGLQSQNLVSTVTGYSLLW